MRNTVNTLSAILATTLLTVTTAQAGGLGGSASGEAGVSVGAGTSGLGGLAAGAQGSGQAGASGSGADASSELGVTAQMGTAQDATGAGVRQADPAVEDKDAVAPQANPDRSLEVTAEALAGKDIVTRDGETIGEVSRVLSNPGGQVLAVETEIGGFLGIGAQTVTIPADRLTVMTDAVVVAMTKAEIKALDRPGVSLDGTAEGRVEAR